MILLFILLAVSLYVFHQFYWRRRKLPPGNTHNYKSSPLAVFSGPMPWPIFGNALSFKYGNAEKAAHQWAKTYGDIQTVWFGSKPIVTLHDIPTIYETFLKDGDAYVDRPVDHSMDVMKGGSYGVGGTNGVVWREHRRFALRVFREFGLGRNLMQEKILVEVMGIISDIRDDVKSGKEVLSLQDEIDRGVGSVINLITFGFRFDRSKTEEFKKVKQYAANVVETSGNFLMRIMKNNINFFRRLPTFKEYYEHVVQNSRDCEEFFMKLINDHKKKVNLESDQDPVDYVEAYMKEQYRLRKNGDKSNLYSDKQLYGMVFDLWVAGQETSSTTLSWLFLYIINRPDMQKKIHDELDSVVGSDRAVTLEDKTKLNYLNAVIAETHRYCNLGSFNVPHQLNKDTVIHGYNIPKGMWITYQIATVNRDTRYYDRPTEFIPERFLDKDGKFFNPPSLLPFGIGKRACLGEGLAKLELYLFSANVFNQMRLLPPGKEKITEERVVRTTNCCKPYECRIELRY